MQHVGAYFSLISEGVRLIDDKTGDVLTVEELVAYLKTPKSTLYKLVQEGKIPYQKVGRHWRFHKESIDFWLNEKPEVKS